LVPSDLAVPSPSPWHLQQRVVDRRYGEVSGQHDPSSPKHTIFNDVLTLPKHSYGRGGGISALK